MLIELVPGNTGTLFSFSFMFSSSVAWAAAFTLPGQWGRVGVFVTFCFVCRQIWGFCCDSLLVQVLSPRIPQPTSGSHHLYTEACK